LTDAIATEPAASRRPLRFLLSTLIATALVVALALWGGVDWREMGRTLLRLPLSSFLLAMLLHIAIYCARAQRFRLLMPHAARPSLLSTFIVSSAHNLAVYVLPAKTGEATLPLYLKSACGVPVSTGLASLLVSRLLDLATLSAMLAVVTAILCAGSQWSAPLWVGVVLVAALVVATLAFLALSARGERVVAWLERCVRFAHLEHTALGRKLIGSAAHLAEAMRVAGGEGRIARAVPLSVAVWLGIFAFYGVLAGGFGLPEHVGFLEASFGSSLAVLSNLLPINAFAGFGTQEAGWVFGFHLVGVDANVSLANGIGVHLVQLFDTLLFGVLGHIGMGLIRRRA
jgi:uncharacterized protein (TIRG00374 family)